MIDLILNIILTIAYIILGIVWTLVLIFIVLITFILLNPPKEYHFSEESKTNSENEDYLRAMKSLNENEVIF
jgi:uncharacterized membrane protein